MPQPKNQSPLLVESGDEFRVDAERRLGRELEYFDELHEGLGAAVFVPESAGLGNLAVDDRERADAYAARVETEGHLEGDPSAKRVAQ